MALEAVCVLLFLAGAWLSFSLSWDLYAAKCCNSTRHGNKHKHKFCNMGTSDKKTQQSVSSTSTGIHINK